MGRQLSVALALLVGLAAGATAMAAVDSLSAGPGDGGNATESPPGGDETDTDSNSSDSTGPQLQTFDGPDEFAAYVQARAINRDFVARATNGADTGGADAGDGAASGTATPMATPTPVATQTEAAREPTGEDDAESGDGERVGTTNVQETAIDEPDVVKTDGRHFFFANRRTDRRYEAGATYVVDADDAASPELVGEINETGRLMLVGDTLVVLRDDALVGLDVSDPTDPERQWSRDRNGSLVSARAVDGQVYLVVRQRATESSSCPLQPLEGATVDCDEIYRPEERVPVDATYTVISLDPSSGETDDAVGFVGTAHSSAVYMAQGSLYVTYTDPIDDDEVYANALLASETVPEHVKERVREIRSYDLSPRAREIEVRNAVETWLASRNESERERVRESLHRDVTEYAETNARNFTTTGIVRVAVGDGLDVAATGEVPGRPLNQFSLDQHEGHLRIATTVPGLASESENDVYTLDTESLDRVGAVQGMGKDQEIYAVRYVGDTAYLVTFRRVDPFHVVDLSDPSDPVETGELKLPGFSEYLHPVDDDTILGVGREDGRVKAVLFDVSDPTNPTIADSTVFDRRWSAVSETHHAFTMDRRHGVFFLPTGTDGLVVDYQNETLSVETTVDVGGAVRARYVGDYLYVFGRDEIEVVDERTWNRTATVPLD